MKIIHKIILLFYLSLLTSNIPGQRIVAEWEPALGTMIRWPLGIPSTLVVELASDDLLYVLVENTQQQSVATSNFENWNVNMSNVSFIYTSTYSHWTRDHGPQFLIGEDTWKVINQKFDGYPEESGCDINLNSSEYDGRNKNHQIRGWEEDDDTNIDFANQLGWDILNLPLYFTGGNFMTDGYGMGFATELMVNENDVSEFQFKALIEEYLDLESFHIFDNPNVLSIQHIDCMAKLVDSETVIIKQVSELSPEYDCIENFADAFYELNTFYGRPFEIHRIFCPSINGAWWEINPVAAYTNSLILNEKVLVPQYGIFHDQAALETYKNVMPGYNVIGFEAATNEPWYGEDALHCRTMGIFDPDMIHISHKSIRTSELNINPIFIDAEIIDYSGIGIESTVVHWKYDDDENFSEFPLTLNENNYYNGEFPFLDINRQVSYYLESKNYENTIIKNPISGWHTFIIDGIIGDINNDSALNIQDVIILINFILSNEYYQQGDLNLDSQLNILDIIQLVNEIIG